MKCVALKAENAQTNKHRNASTVVCKIQLKNSGCCLSVSVVYQLVFRISSGNKTELEVITNHRQFPFPSYTMYKVLISDDTVLSRSKSWYQTVALQKSYTLPLSLYTLLPTFRHSIISPAEGRPNQCKTWYGCPKKCDTDWIRITLSISSQLVNIK